ncbi:DEAD/DEAH box helicase [Arenibaculum sp.]|uniref:DEAD/DEAH box helicase n=1 Tax=Arenibaculum sp. TaxID=2865862 RepID=UPI0039C8570D
MSRFAGPILETTTIGLAGIRPASIPTTRAGPWRVRTTLKDHMITFSALPLRAEIQAALGRQGYDRPTPIQQQAIPPALDGRDILGIAQTGTGKTAAFTVPILQRLSAVPGAAPRPGRTRALILTPTRELAIQIGESIAAYGAGLRLTHSVIFGGVGQQPQVDALNRGRDLIVATPGRLLDLCGQGHLKLDGLEVFVLDEADRMLDMGFIRDVRKVVAMLPRKRQSLFFSATMPDEVADLAARLLTDPVRVEVTPVASTAERIDQQVIFVPAAAKRQLLVDLLRSDPSMDRTIVFTRTKHGANKVAQFLEKAAIGAAAIHGNKSQSARQAALEGFRTGAVRVLVATDIAARGIDIDAISHVVNFDLPNVPESYVHRIGRTARAGASGMAIAFCDEGEERVFLRDIEKLIGTRIPVVPGPAIRTPVDPADDADARDAAPRRPGNRNGHRGPRAGTPHSGPKAQSGQGRPTHRDGHRDVHREKPVENGARPRQQGAGRANPSFGDLVAAIGKGEPEGSGPGRNRPRRTGSR